MSIFQRLREYLGQLGELARKISEEEAYEKLHEYSSKLDRGELPNADEMYTLSRIERFAKSEKKEELKNMVDSIYSKIGEVAREIVLREGEDMEVNDEELRKIYKKDGIKITYTRIKLK